MRSEIHTAVGTEIAVFWVVVPCSLVNAYNDLDQPVASILSAEE